MIKKIITLTILLSVLPIFANTQKSIDDVVAPSVESRGDLVNVELGTLVYDYTDGKFYGKGLGTTWQELGNDEKVFAEYKTDITQSIASNDVIDFEDKIVDSHNAVTTGASWRFTAPRDGIYQVQFAAKMSTSATGIGGLFAKLYKNGSINKEQSTLSYTGYSQAFVGSFSISLVEGDYINVHIDPYTDGDLSGSSSENWITIQSL